MQEETEFDPNNVVCLCQKHHKIEHGEKVDGRDRYSLCGIEAEEVIATVLENAYLASGGERAAEIAWDVANALKYQLRLGKKDDIRTELGKAENYLHHARTGEWLK